VVVTGVAAVVGEEVAVEALPEVAEEVVAEGADGAAHAVEREA